ncbi:MAG: DUF1592 domain-containing protein, partial [Rubripirellula sp.]
MNQVSFKYSRSLIALLICGWFTSPAVAAERAEGFADHLQPMFAKHCVQCHGADDDVMGDVNLAAMTGVEDLLDDPELLQNLIRVIDLGEMPPDEEAALQLSEREDLLRELRTQLNFSIGRDSELGVTPMRRMNRFQYNNAVQDLFELKCVVLTLPERMMRDHSSYFQPAAGKVSDSVKVGSRPLGKSQLIERRLAGVAAFPQDLRAEHGYDNRGDQLSLSPLLMESFLSLSQSVTQSPDFNARNVGIWKSFFVEPSGDAELSEMLQERLRPFLLHAFRRPVDDATVDRYVNYAAAQIDSGVEYAEAMKMVAAAVIASPKFLYLYDEAGSVSERLASFDLASRLSFFLWGSLPDRELLDVAAAGDLAQPNILEGQFNRMIQDRKLKRFCDSFPSQWLQLDRIISSVPNRDEFPGFYIAKYRQSMHMMLEPLLLFETVLIEDLPITQLIDSDFTYRSALLRKAYGDPPMANSGKGGGVTVLNFDRQPITDRRQGGVITNAAVMTMTSGPERTQPITRGAWVATVVFNQPPEPPPADVPSLDEKPPEGEEDLTLRERLALHRERADCAGCHERIDPIGFALENYDPIGRWRDQYENGRDVDMEGKLFRKHAFTNVVEFKDAILAEKDRFTRGFAGHVLSFALARELGPADQPAIDKVAGTTAEDDYKIQTLLRQVVLSEPF